jgi:hypothetical protein
MDHVWSSYSDHKCEGAAIQAHELWVDQQLGLILKQKLRETSPNVSL